MSAKRIINAETGEHVLTFHGGKEVYNYPTALQALADMTGQIVHHVVFGQSFGQFKPTGVSAIKPIPEGWYDMLHGSSPNGEDLAWRRRTGSFYIEAREDDNADAPTDSPVLQLCG